VSWELRLPYRDRDQPLDDPDVLALPQALEDRDQRAIATRLLLQAMETPGMETVGDLLDVVEALDEGERRLVLDRCRERAGLETATDVDDKQQLESLQQEIVRRGSVERDSDGLAHQLCAHEGCTVEPINEKTGTPARTAAKRWWCPTHRGGHEADMQPFQFGWTFAKSGAILSGDEVAQREAEAERERVRLESRRRAREAEQAQRLGEADEVADVERARRARLERETPRGMPIP
jgi:hypothetical protein